MMDVLNTFGIEVGFEIFFRVNHQYWTYQCCNQKLCKSISNENDGAKCDI